MTGRELLFAALFLFYFVSRGTCLYTDIRQCAPDGNNDIGDMRAPWRRCCPLNPLAQVNYEWYGMICTGFHLKPWIVATTADCVDGRNKDKLSVTVNNAHTWEDTITANVSSFTINEKYNKSTGANNLALLLIQNQDDEYIILFGLPDEDFTPKILLDRKIQIYVSEWEVLDHLRLVSYRKEYYATSTLIMCNYYGTEKEGYCIFRNNYAPIYTERDEGSPVYYEDGTTKVLLGVYTGYKNGESTNGRVFQNTYPMVNWIKEFLGKNPNPPPGN